MNLQQKKYTIERLTNIAQKAAETIAQESNDTCNTYYNETCITVQMLLANDRELLMALPIKEDLPLDASANRSLYYIFETAELQRSLEEQHALISPEIPTSDGRVKLTPKAEPVMIRYHLHMAKFNQLKTDLMLATDTIMIGSSADALDALQSFQSKYS